MRTVAAALVLLVALGACGRESSVDSPAREDGGDAAAMADRKAREDAAAALERRAAELRGVDRTQARKLAEEARAMRDRDRAARTG